MPMTSNRDRDCAFLARAALFPLKVNRDGTHAAQFPALEAVGKVRDDAIAANPNRSPSSFFPHGVVVVRALDGNDGEFQWNGQPDVVERTASFDVIPQVLKLRCMECLQEQPGRNAFVAYDEKSKCKEIVLCTDRLLKRDYVPDRAQDLPPRSFGAVEEALAHQVTVAGDQLKFDRGDKGSSGDITSDPSTCEGFAASEIRAARVAECRFSRAEKEVKRGSHLPIGYSLLPLSFQRSIMARCIRAAATKATGEKFGKEEGQQYVEKVFDKVMSEEGRAR